MPERRHVIVTCEHAGNRVPAPYRSLFGGREDLLQSHRGYDIGISPLARRLAEALGAPLFAGTVTRLLVDLNRAPYSRALFSGISGDLPREERERILARYYRPYRQAVTAEVIRGIEEKCRVLHLSLHSFTPELRGEVRCADLGLLYDPSHSQEAAFCSQLRQALRERDPTLRVRRNYPYRGVSDSLVTALRRRFAGDGYLGIEIEVNQKHTQAGGKGWRRLQRIFTAAVRDLLGLSEFSRSS